MNDARAPAANASRAGKWNEESGRDGNSWGDSGKEKARAAEARVQEMAWNFSSRNWGGRAAARAQGAAWAQSSRHWGGHAAARAQATARSHSDRHHGGDAAGKTQETTSNALNQDWGRYGRERARQAERRARNVASGPGDRGNGDVEQETGVVG